MSLGPDPIPPAGILKNTGLIMNHDAANDTGIVTALSEQLRLAREELRRLRDRLADAELGLATFQQQVAAFKRQYWIDIRFDIE